LKIFEIPRFPWGKWWEELLEPSPILGGELFYSLGETLVLIE